MKELIERLYKEDLLWFFMANLISAEALHNEHDCESALYIIDNFNDCLMDDTLDVDLETKEKTFDLLKKSKEIVENEYGKFKLS